jgi:hypothetical protein
MLDADFKHQASDRIQQSDYSLNQRDAHIYITSYAAVRVWSGFCLRQHGSFHPLYAIFRAKRGKSHTNKIKERSAEGKNN